MFWIGFICGFLLWLAIGLAAYKKKKNKNG